MFDIALIKARIAARAEDFLRELFGEKLHRAGQNKWRVGKRGSLAIEVIDGELVFYDNEASVGGDCFRLWTRERGGDKGDAITSCAAWASVVNDPSYTPPPAQKSITSPKLNLDSRPSRWPMIDEQHDALWRFGIDRLINDPDARTEIGRWRGWEPGTLIPLARAGLISAPAFDLWPAVIDPQPCVCFRVLHPEHVSDGNAKFWASHPAQLHIRFHPGATRRDGSPLSWIYAPTMKRIGVEDGGNAPLIIARDGRDPDQPGYGTRCRCVIVCAGEWDALVCLLASWWIDEHGTLTVPPGLAIVGIRGEGRSGTDAYLRHYAHWKPDAAILLADADKTGLSWFESQDGRPCFAEQVERRGATVLRFTPSGHKDIGDFYRTGNFGLPQIETMLTRAEFPLSQGGCQR